MAEIYHYNWNTETEPKDPIDQAKRNIQHAEDSLALAKSQLEEFY